MYVAMSTSLVINTCKILDENILINLQVIIMVKVRVIRKIWVFC